MDRYDFTICYTFRDNMAGPGANDSYGYIELQKIMEIKLFSRR
jgi:hypothetical protein